MILIIEYSKAKGTFTLVTTNMTLPERRDRVAQVMGDILIDPTVIEGSPVFAKVILDRVKIVVIHDE